MFSVFSEIIQGMDRHMILKFGNRRVLLLSPNGASATVSQCVNGKVITFDYSACELIGILTIEEGQAEPTPEDFYADRERFYEECDAKIIQAFQSAGLLRVNDGPVKYLGMTENGTQYKP
jgi:hypothetical protein